MFTSGTIDTVAADQSGYSASTIDESGAEMLRVVGGILARGTYGLNDVELIRSIAGDEPNGGDRRFAWGVIHWLAQQSAIRTDAIWQRNGDARH